MDYILDLIALDQNGNYLEGEYPYCRACGGEDEYDALISFIRKYFSDLNEEDYNFNIHLSRIRPCTDNDNLNNNELQLKASKNFAFKEEISDYIADILTTFGFRITKKDNDYIVRIPSFYITDTIIEYLDDRQVYKLDSLDLIMLWNNNIMKWTDRKDREYYGIKDDEVLVKIDEYINT